MLRLLLSLRFGMLFAAFGAILGAALMFYLGGAKIARAVVLILTEGASATEVTVAVLSATDAFLFGVVLIVFAYAISLGLVLGPSALIDQLPRWMRIEGIGELKHTLVEVIIVYLIVDFATDLASRDEPLSWTTLVMPLSIVLIAGALRLVGRGSGSPEGAPGSPTHD